MKKKFGKKNGYQMTPTPLDKQDIADMRIAEAAARHCEWARARPAGNTVLHFQPGQISNLRRLGYQVLRMQDGRTVIRNRFTGERITIEADPATGKVFVGLAITNGIGKNRQLKYNGYADDEWTRANMFLREIAAGKNQKETARLMSLTRREFELAKAIDSDRSRESKFDYCQTAALAIRSGVVVPECIGRFGPAIEIALMVLANNGVPIDAVVFTGTGVGGTLAQFFALKYGLHACCFFAIAMGAVLQNILGFGMIAKNAYRIVSYEAATSQLWELLGALLYVLLGIQTGAIPGRRFVAKLQDRCGELTPENIALFVDVLQSYTSVGQCSQFSC
ncbi:MAG: hypothetical protein LBB38_04430 [Puniceicoccales bacterium]|jgi:hypothetical protein|nr:hypothetical protein [Puniceicoccales bacterium]